MYTNQMDVPFLHQTQTLYLHTTDYTSHVRLPGRACTVTKIAAVREKFNGCIYLEYSLAVREASSSRRSSFSM
jgi:hypothetical protein